MINRVLVVSFLSTFVSNVFAVASLPDCSGGDLSMQGANASSCISTCSAVADYPAAQLSTGSSGFCAGNATQSKFNVYKVQLGVSTAAEPTCELWSGNFEMNKASYAVSDSVSPGGSYQNCTDGAYNTVFVTIEKKETFSGSAEFPDGSGKIAKTTSAFATDSISTYTDSSTFLETSTSHTDSSLPYVRPSSGWNTIYKKLSSAPSDSNLSSSSESSMVYDWSKVYAEGGHDTSVFSGWYCEDSSGNFCEKVDSDGRLIMRMTKDLDGISFPTSTGIHITQENQAAWNLSYYGLNTNKERGAIFLWRNDGGTLKYLGVKPGDSGIQMTISNYSTGLN